MQDPKSFEEALLKTLSDTMEQTSERVRRRAELSSVGIRPEHAAIIDDAFSEAARNVALALGKGMDGLSPDLWSVGLPFILTGVRCTIEQFEQEIIQQLLEMSISRGARIAVIMGQPDCDCAVCQAKRNQDANDTRQTRH